MKSRLILGSAATLAAAALTALTLTGCGQGPINGTIAPGPNSAAMVVTAGDAPLSNILAAKVTVSSISLTPSGGGSDVTVLSTPRTIELSSLGAIQEPIEIENVPAGTYSNVKVTVSSATATYVDSTNATVHGTATVNSGTETVSFSPSLTVTQNQDVHLKLDFNLAKSFDLSGSTLTFTPSITAAAASIEGENETEREVEVTGSVVSVSSASIVVQSADSGVQSTFAIDSATQFSTGLSTGSIVAGEIVTVHGTIQADGFLATRISASNEAGSMENPQGGIGIVTAVKTGTSGNVIAFTFVPREDFGDMPSSDSVTVTLPSSTTYGVDAQARADGISTTAFNNAEIFPGQSVEVLGTVSSGSIAAKEVDLAPESLSGTLSTAPTATSTGYSFKLLLATHSFLTTYGLPNPLSASTNAQTQYEDKLTASGFASLATGTALEVHGYLLLDPSNNYLLTVSNIAQTETESGTETETGTETD